MASMNKVLLMGNLAQSPDLRYTRSGTAVCSFRLAMNRRTKRPDGEMREEVCFVDVRVWSQQAEAAERYLDKGSSVLVEGRLELDSWQDRATGQRRSRLKVRADELQFMGRPARKATFSEDMDASDRDEPRHTKNAGAEQQRSPDVMPDLEGDIPEGEDVPF